MHDIPFRMDIHEHFEGGKAMKKLMTGNEAVARGCYEAGVHFASAYPGTPSTEILENLSTYDEIYAEWAPNEKVALESVIGASIAGARSIASMKHVGINVAADPLFTFVYTGVNGGSVVISADEPGQHSSQNEQDNRNYARHAKMPMMEPSDSQECKDMIKLAFDVSEEFDIPVLFRMTTRVCHAKSIVEFGDRTEVAVKKYEKNPQKYVSVPANARVMRADLEKRMERLQEYSNTSELNFIEYNDDKKEGVIVAGACYGYAKEVFGDKVSYLKLGFTYPMPDEKIKEFCDTVETVYVIEENDPFIEDHCRALGYDVKGKDVFPAYGEMLPEVIRKSVYGEEFDTIEYDGKDVVGRPPTLCAGCPHRGFFYELGKKKNVMFSGDIGCYTLGVAPPFNAIDTTICMGGSFSMGHGAQKVFNMENTENEGMRVVSMLGDSTFFHTGINSLINVLYNKSNTVNVILDNRITGMTGHQENPGSGFTAKHDGTEIINIEEVVRALGFKHVYVVNPNELEKMRNTINECLALDEPSVIITRWPCVLKKFSAADKEEFNELFTNKYWVDEEVCIGCKKCTRVGCPAVVFQTEKKKSSIDRTMCVGCGVCFQVCPVGAIKKEERA